MEKSYTVRQCTQLNRDAFKAKFVFISLGVCSVMLFSLFSYDLYGAFANHIINVGVVSFRSYEKK